MKSGKENCVMTISIRLPSEPYDKELVVLVLAVGHRKNICKG